MTENVISGEDSASVPIMPLCVFLSLVCYNTIQYNTLQLYCPHKMDTFSLATPGTQNRFFLHSSENYTHLNEKKQKHLNSSHITLHYSSQSHSLMYLSCSSPLSFSSSFLPLSLCLLFLSFILLLRSSLI